MINFDINSINTPYFIVDEALLIKNLEILKGVKNATGCKILLAQKGFAMHSLYPLISQYLDGTCASGLHEAKLAHEFFNGENHVYSPAFDYKSFPEIASICGHITFNSFTQYENLRHLCSGKNIGIRINPEFSTQQHEKPIYDPCAPNSRLGVTHTNFREDLIKNGDINGLHFHTLCQQNSNDLVKTFNAFEINFEKYLYDIQWINLGGGHHITRDDYDIKLLVSLINKIKTKYNLQVYLEPGEAVALNAGYLVASVLDIVDNGIKTAILDTSAATHMPDVLEMPYRPYVINSDLPNVKQFNYRLGGVSCLAGDIIGDYSFDTLLNINDRLIFTDMAIYSMVKTTTFNGVKLADIAIARQNGSIEIIKTFGYNDFKVRLS